MEKKAPRIYHATNSPLTQRQENFCQQYVQEPNGVQTAFRTYNVTTYDSANAVANETLKVPAVQSRIKELLSGGLTLESLKKKHEKLLEAKKPIVVDKEIKYEPDNAIQADMVKTGYKLHGVIDGEEKSVVNNTYNVKMDNVVEMKDTIIMLKQMNEALISKGSSQDPDVT